MTSRLMMVVGTRPEAIKMAPLAHALNRSTEFSLHLCATGQHRGMLDQVLELFALEADSNLAVMTENQTLNGLQARLMTGLDRVYQDVEPELVLVHGDTATCFAATLAAFHRRIPVAHVEAGLRTNNILSPWPEEAYRQMTAVLATLHFAPTASARDNLLRGGAAADAIRVTGNTVIDALLWMRRRLKSERWSPAPDSPLATLRDDSRVVLITGHRRENFGQGFESICQAIKQLAQRYPDVDFVYPVHLNPAVNGVVRPLLGGLPNVILTAPLDYPHFVWLMDRASLILTDSGGVQEEAPALGKPVLVLRNETERVDAQAAGTVRLVGSRTSRIVEETERLLDSPVDYQKMASVKNPYGDGHACERILERLTTYFASVPDSVSC
ncbi:UDP-N-acetylglucosamine 2-epimerase (non-hydrolysing) [Modicisalibacter ilicicola DSM 19980]|uniref:UDP-N-acetylglucosamine 2-epimerase (non-hydrolyzing) n=1 Tax=Modicisalibacter ilicicola DSM 19980 TaxID=1121942 RepID=A0A1M5DV07_9GAMM|nr:UDP-N-acetylglucosamine 2-epimerase (non-hydrolyzing) [Halomonas ilicicola]SHF70756.1 UDP-N-acetylglucosamine 2-epimerase (non-hydrolysing) [Halomonas ilicicola DSM 19980]